jgi:hypothetical protein
MTFLKWPERVWEHPEESQWASRPATRADVDRRIAIEKDLKATVIEEEDHDD